MSASRHAAAAKWASERAAYESRLSLAQAGAEVGAARHDAYTVTFNERPLGFGFCLSSGARAAPTAPPTSPLASAFTSAFAVGVGAAREVAAAPRFGERGERKTRGCDHHGARVDRDALHHPCTT